MRLKTALQRFSCVWQEQFLLYVIVQNSNVVKNMPVRSMLELSLKPWPFRKSFCHRRVNFQNDWAKFGRAEDPKCNWQ